MKKSVLLALVIILIAIIAKSQVAINTDGSQPDNSAMLDISSTLKGILVPRMTLTQVGAIVSPATGLLVFCTDNNQYYSNRGTPGAPNWVIINSQWMSNGANIYFNGGKVGLGTSNPASILDLASGNNWDLTNTEGDMRIGNSSYRLKLGIATGGGGAGSCGIMQYGQPGGYNALNLGSQGKNLVTLFGNNGIVDLADVSGGKVGIGTSAPAAILDLASGNNWDLTGTEGDMRIGNSSYRMKLGIATSGGGAGSCGIMQYGQPGGYNAFNLGSQGKTLITMFGNNGIVDLADVSGGKVGIGTSAPNAPLGFPAVLGKKITLYPGSTGDVGLGVAGNRLQIYADNPNADVALGYDAAGTFNERFAFKPTGALALSGNAGTAGQVISSNGAGSSASWINVKPSFYSFKQNDYQVSLTYTGSSPGEPQSWYVIGGLHNQPITLNQPSTVKLSLKLPVTNTSNVFGGLGICALYLGLYDPANNYIQFDISYLYVSDGATQDGIVFNVVANLPAGSYKTHVKILKYGGDDLNTGYYYTGSDMGTLVAEIYPQ